MSARLLKIKVEEWPAKAHAARYCETTLAKQCDVSVSTLSRYLHKMTGRNPHHWMHEIRIARAKELLMDESSIKETAAGLGYKTHSHFSRDFKGTCGYPPSEHALRMLGMLGKHAEKLKSGKQRAEI